MSTMPKLTNMPNTIPIQTYQKSANKLKDSIKSNNFTMPIEKNSINLSPGHKSLNTNKNNSTILNTTKRNLHNKTLNETSVFYIDSEQEFQIPRNINSFKHLYDTCKLNDKEIGWVLNLRNHDNSFQNYSTFKDHENNPPGFYNDDLYKYTFRKRNKDPREEERSIYDPHIHENGLYYEHLFKKRIGETGNQTQVSFETSLRNEPDLTIPSGNHPKLFKNKKKFINKKFFDLPYNGIETEPVYPPPINLKVLDRLEKLKEPITERDLVVRPIKYKLEVRIILKLIITHFNII